MEFDRDDGDRDKNLAHGVHDWEIAAALGDLGRRRVRSMRVDGGELRVIVLGQGATSGRTCGSFTLLGCDDLHRARVYYDAARDFLQALRLPIPGESQH
ncbi:MAG: hypothetical protein WEB13_07265 [Dehalococcoidia bacterium]